LLRAILAEAVIMLHPNPGAAVILSRSNIRSNKVLSLLVATFISLPLYPVNPIRQDTLAF